MKLFFVTTTKFCYKQDKEVTAFLTEEVSVDWRDNSLEREYDIHTPQDMDCYETKPFLMTEAEAKSLKDVLAEENPHSRSMFRGKYKTSWQSLFKDKNVYFKEFKLE